MERKLADIPEAFRRAMREEGWDTQAEEEGGNGSRPPSEFQPWWTRRWFWLGGLALLLLLSFDWVVTTYTEWLWFTQLGYRRVWLTQWSVRVATFAAGFAVAAVALLTNWRIALARGRQGRRRAPFDLLRLPGIGWLINAAALLLAALFAAAAASQWELLLRYFNRVPFGDADPIFGRDISFYVFELPVYRFLQGWMLPLLLMAMLGTLAIYAAGGASRRQQGALRPPTPVALRRQMAVLASLFLALWAAGYWLGTFELLYSSRGFAFGAGYADVRAVLPALRAQMVVMGLVALAAAANFFRPNLRLPLAAGAIWLLVAVILGAIYPALLQRYVVEPNELALEGPYIAHNIALTRLAFGLDEVEVRPFGDAVELSEADLAQNEAALQNVRLWDYRPLQQSYSQLQELRPYYQFHEIDIDRYQIDGFTRQVMLAGRELNKANLSGQSWVNQRLEFTHGYGLVMNPVDRFTPEGRPEFFIRDLPPVSTVPVEVTRPEIYFGELMSDIVFVNSGLEEFDYPQGNENVYSSYGGDGGVPLGGALRRLAFALRFGEPNLLLSQYITPQTQILFHRQIGERVRRITPFLVLDSDPYIVVADGRLVWMIDAYTISADFPYATRTEQGINYIRNAVKITVDAYDGRVSYYLARPDDPLIQSYARAFPGLFRPLADLPTSLQPHIRYPEDLFIVQTRQYLTYHMTDVQVFYNQEDRWEIPQEIFDNAAQPIEPYYILFRLPGEAQTEYLLIQPYTPAGRNNMIAWIAARNDPPHYGKLVAYEMPKQSLVFGPIQVEGRIDQDAQISQQLNLWNQRGSRVIRGNLIVIPLNRSFLYVEPLYLLSSTSALPELKRVIVASGNRIAMRETLDEALTALLQEAPSVDVIVDELPVSDGEAPPPPADATVEALIRSANAHFEAAEAAQRQGDWTTYGRELELLQQDLQRLVELAGEAQ